MPQVQIRQQRRPETRRRPGGVTWDDAVDAFLGAKRSENLSPSTLTNYEWHLRGPRARVFLKDHKITAPVGLTAEALEALQRELLEAGVSPALTHAFHRVWKNFAGFCIKRSLGTGPGILAVRGPKQPHREPETFRVEEERQMLAAARSPRDRLIIELMLRTGLRLEEVTNLTIDDVMDGPSGAYLRVRQGKGSKDRVVPLDTARVKLSSRIRHYIRSERPADGSSRALFLSRRHQGDDHEPLSKRGLQLMMRRLGQETGIHIHPHKFRHTFATRSLAAGVDVMALQRVLGHATLAMVSRYVHYQRDDLIDAWRRRQD